MKKLLAILTIGLVSGLGAQAATINVPADQATIQAAINAAAPGDVINIADGTYTEDLIFKKSAALPQNNNITLQGSSPNNVIIDCPNTSPANSPALNRGILGAISGAFGAGALPEHKGVIIEGDNITLRNLTIRNSSTTGDPLFGESAAVCLMGDNCTIENCIIEANPNNDIGRCLYVLTGDWAAANGSLAPFYPSPGLSALNLTVTDTIFRYGDATFDTVDAAFYLFAVGFVPSQPPVRVGTGTFTNCEFVGLLDPNDLDGGIGEIDGGVYSFTDCHFHTFNDGMDSGGGSWTFTNCVFENSRNNYAASANFTGEGGPGQTQFNFLDSIFCGNINGGGAIQLRENDTLISGCIFSATNGDDRPVVSYRPGDYDSDWALPIFGGYPASSNVTIDHCDIYNPNGRGVEGTDPQDVAGEPVGNLTVTNTIFTCANPVNLIGAAGLAARNATITNSNLYTTGTISHPDNGWVLTQASNLNVLPGYANAGGCDPADYVYGNAALATASTTGGGIGSQTAPPPPAASVEKWEVYE